VLCPSETGAVGGGGAAGFRRRAAKFSTRSPAPPSTTTDRMAGAVPVSCKHGSADDSTTSKQDNLIASPICNSNEIMFTFSHQCET